MISDLAPFRVEIHTWLPEEKDAELSEIALNKIKFRNVGHIVIAHDDSIQNSIRVQSCFLDCPFYLLKLEMFGTANKGEENIFN